MLRSAGYSTETATTTNVASLVLSEDTGRIEEEATLRRGGHPAATAEIHERISGQGEVTGGASGDVFDALLWLLICLPGVVGVVQVCLWQAY
eukprot:COSAG02_NODE_12475_length_1540_cov_0.825121_2_plen_91_part_01